MSVMKVLLFVQFVIVLQCSKRCSRAPVHFTAAHIFGKDFLLKSFNYTEQFIRVGRLIKEFHRDATCFSHDDIKNVLEGDEKSVCTSNGTLDLLGQCKENGESPGKFNFRRSRNPDQATTSFSPELMPFIGLNAHLRAKMFNPLERDPETFITALEGVMQTLCSVQLADGFRPTRVKCDLRGNKEILILTTLLTRNMDALKQMAKASNLTNDSLSHVVSHIFMFFVMLYALLAVVAAMILHRLLLILIQDFKSKTRDRTISTTDAHSVDSNKATSSSSSNRRRTNQHQTRRPEHPEATRPAVVGPSGTRDRPQTQPQALFKPVPAGTVHRSKAQPRPQPQPLFKPVPPATAHRKQSMVLERQPQKPNHGQQFQVPVPRRATDFSSPPKDSVITPAVIVQTPPLHQNRRPVPDFGANGADSSPEGMVLRSGLTPKRNKRGTTPSTQSGKGSSS